MRQSVMRLAVMVLCLVGLGCADAGYLMQRAMLSADCRPDHLQANGQCTPLK